MKIVSQLASMSVLALCFPSCSHSNLAKAVPPASSTAKSVEVKDKTLPEGYKPSGKSYNGKASYYAIKCNGGTATASGERLRDEALTAAHKTLPMGTKVLVTNKANGKKIVVRINDRGPYVKGRIIDLTFGAAKQLGMVGAGVVPCEVEVLEKVKTPAKPSPGIHS